MLHRTHRRVALLGAAISTLVVVGVANAAWTANGSLRGNVKSGKVAVSVYAPDGGAFTPSINAPMAPGERAEFAFNTINTGDFSATFTTTAWSSEPCFITSLAGISPGLSEPQGYDTDVDFDPGEGYTYARLYVEVSDEPACMDKTGEVGVDVVATMSQTPRR